MSSELTIGTDPPASPATQGYALNHVALVVFDIELMRHFYGDILGMRHIMTHKISSSYEITYMGYPISDSGYQTGKEMLKQLRQRNGLLEFLHPIAEKQGNIEAKKGRFSHLGVVVPDLKAAEKRLKNLGVPILKGLGDESLEPGSSVAEWWGMDERRVLEAREGLKSVAWGNVLLVTDPDGNVVEVQERT